MLYSLPKQLQSVLWSQSLAALDKERDKPYIIHQIFSHGRMEDIRWVFETYSKPEIKEVFTHHPFKDYDAARFHFVKNYLLALKGHKLNEQRYVKNTPRDIR